MRPRYTKVEKDVIQALLQYARAHGLSNQQAFRWGATVFEGRRSSRAPQKIAVEEGWVEPQMKRSRKQRKQLDLPLANQESESRPCSVPVSEPIIITTWDVS